MDKREYNEIPVGDMKMWLPPGAEKARNLTGPERESRRQLDEKLTAKAEQRQDVCWMRTATHCKNTPTRWVREVQFDFKEDKAGINFAQISSSDLPGPVPGFCASCIDYAAHLAELVYFNHIAVRMGMRPRRWHVIFTDGLKSGGSIQQIDPNPKDPTVVEEYINNDREEKANG